MMEDTNSRSGTSISDKRAELLSLYNDLFSAVRTQLDKVKSGEVILKASLLAEMNKFLSQGFAILQRLQDEENKEAVRRQYERVDEEGYGGFETDDGIDGGIDGGIDDGIDDDAIPFPVSDEPLKIS